MPIHTSPSPANVAFNGNQTTWWIPARNLSNHVATNVVVDVSLSPVGGLAPVTYAAEVGVFNFLTGKWQVGVLQPLQEKWLKIVTSVADIGAAPFTITSVISGDGIDPNNLNNTLVQTVTSVVTSPTAGSNDDVHQPSHINVSLNDTACNYGITEWRLNASSLTNTTNYVWDVTTGQGHFIHIDPTKPITGSYSIWCDPGTGFVEIACGATFSIDPLYDNHNIFDFIIYQVDGSALTLEEQGILTAQYPGYVLADYTWNILKNSQGEVTSGVPIPIVKELTGYLCDTNNQVIFVWNNNGVVSYKKTDGTNYLGNVLDLGNCCCAEVNIED